MKWHVEYRAHTKYRTETVWSDELNSEWELSVIDIRNLLQLAPGQTYEDSRQRVWTRA